MSADTSKFGMSRRSFLKAGAALVVFPAPQVLAQTSEPFRVGFLSVLTGPLAAGGKQQEEGAARFLKERDGRNGGRKSGPYSHDHTPKTPPAETKVPRPV